MKTKEWNIVNNVMMYMWNTSVIDFALDVFGKEWNAIDEYEQEYIGNKFALQTEVWSALDNGKQQALIRAAMSKYGEEELIAENKRLREQYAELREALVGDSPNWTHEELIKRALELIE